MQLNVTIKLSSGSAEQPNSIEVVGGTHIDPDRRDQDVPEAVQALVARALNGYQGVPTVRESNAERVVPGSFVSLIVEALDGLYTPAFDERTEGRNDAIDDAVRLVESLSTEATD